jgi:hypothetical protein
LTNQYQQRNLIFIVPPEGTDDTNKTLQLFKEFREHYGAYVDHVEKVVDKGFDLNKQISSFHERLILICIGTLGLSITALTAFIPKLQSDHFPRPTFIKIVVPAWPLLFISITVSRAVMGHIVVANKYLMEQWKRAGDAFNVKQMCTALTALSNSINTTLQVEIEGKNQNAVALLKELATKIDKAIPSDMEAVNTKELAAAQLTGKRVKWLSHIAILSMQIGHLLLGISAIKLFLSF